MAKEQYNDIILLNKELDHAKMVAVRSFLSAVSVYDVEGIKDGLISMDTFCCWRDFFLLARKAKSICLDSRYFFARFWCEYGDTIRNEVGDDSVLISGLWKLLPSYHGRPRTLYRGCSMISRKHRSYGPSWTSDLIVAKSYAINFHKMSGDPSVLIKTIAPPDAIVCEVSCYCESFEEDEFIVDRRRLHAVDVIDRFD